MTYKSLFRDTEELDLDGHSASGLGGGGGGQAGLLLLDHRGLSGSPSAGSAENVLMVPQNSKEGSKGDSKAKQNEVLAGFEDDGESETDRRWFVNIWGRICTCLSPLSQKEHHSETWIRRLKIYSCHPLPILGVSYIVLGTMTEQK